MDSYAYNKNIQAVTDNLAYIWEVKEGIFYYCYEIVDQYFVGPVSLVNKGPRSMFHFKVSPMRMLPQPIIPQVTIYVVM